MTDKEYEEYKKGEDELSWTEVETEHLVRDRWIDFRKVKYRLPDGTEFEPYYNYSRRSYVVIVASDEDGNFLCVRQYRHGIRKVTTEFPAGGIELSGEKEYPEREQTMCSKETALAAAKRELQEETGYVSDEWKHVITIPSNATLSDNFAYIYEASNCRKVSGLDLDDTEFLNVKILSKEDLEDLIKRGAFEQAVHVMAWYMTRSERKHSAETEHTE